MTRWLAIALTTVAVVGCGGSDGSTSPAPGSAPRIAAPGPSTTNPVVTSGGAASGAAPPAAPGPTITDAPAPASTSSATTVASTPGTDSLPAPTTATVGSAPGNVAAPEATATTAPARDITALPNATTTTHPVAPPMQTGVTSYAVPSPDPGSSWGRTHAGYTATDIFVPSGCGGDVVSPVDGVLLEVRRVDGWDPQVDNPATRGGRSIAILGDDGVRYYLAHFAEIEPALAPDVRVAAGERLGSVGTTGRSSACHIHFGISPPCPDEEWSVRRGAVWPYPYLDAWRRGEQLSPVEEIRAWIAEHPDACALAALDPNAGDA